MRVFTRESLQSSAGIHLALLLLQLLQLFNLYSMKQFEKLPPQQGCLARMQFSILPLQQGNSRRVHACILKVILDQIKFIAKKTI
jgi:hypothetical protein